MAAYMSLFCFYFSVRLGAIVAGILGIVSSEFIYSNLPFIGPDCRFIKTKPLVVVLCTEIKSNYSTLIWIIYLRCTTWLFSSLVSQLSPVWFRYRLLFQIQNVVPQLVLWLQGPKNLRDAALDYQKHINEYHRESHFDAFVEYLAKSEKKTIAKAHQNYNEHLFCSRRFQSRTHS